MELRGSSHFSSEHTVCSPANSGLRARRFATLHSGSAGLIYWREILSGTFYFLNLKLISLMRNELILYHILWFIFAACRVGYCVVAAGYVGCGFKVCDVLIYGTIEQVICEGVALCRYCFDIYFDIACGCDRD